MDEILKAIQEAEEEAVRIKERALARASEIAACAEEEISRSKKCAEEACKAFREERIRSAQQRAQAAYDAALEESRRCAKEYAEKVTAETERCVREVVRRVCGGDL